jgi:hypothetical protein
MMQQMKHRWYVLKWLVFLFWPQFQYFVHALSDVESDIWSVMLVFYPVW